MTTAAQIRNIAAEQLAGVTLAGPRVFTPRTFPTWNGDYPLLFLQPPDERGMSAGPNGTPSYTTTATLLISARVQVPVLPNDAGAAAALVQLETMLAQIKFRIINNPAFWNAGLQEFSDFQSKCSLETKEMVIGEGLFSINMVYRTDADQFYSEAYPYLEAIEVTTVAPDGTPDTGARIELYPADSIMNSVGSTATLLNKIVNTDIPASVDSPNIKSE